MIQVGSGCGCVVMMVMMITEKQSKHESGANRGWARDEEFCVYVHVLHRLLAPPPDVHESFVSKTLWSGTSFREGKDETGGWMNGDET